jgi:hypothetical protein
LSYTDAFLTCGNGTSEEEFGNFSMSLHGFAGKKIIIVIIIIIIVTANQMEITLRKNQWICVLPQEKKNGV